MVINGVEIEDTYDNILVTISLKNRRASACIDRTNTSSNEALIAILNENNVDKIKCKYCDDSCGGTN